MLQIDKGNMRHNFDVCFQACALSIPDHTSWVERRRVAAQEHRSSKSIMGTL